MLLAATPIPATYAVPSPKYDGAPEDKVGIAVNKVAVCQTLETAKKWLLKVQLT